VPELLLGLALIAFVVTGFVVADAIKDAKAARDTIRVTGSAKHPNAEERTETIVEGIGGDLGAVRSARLGAYQVTPRNSTEVSDYGINDTSSREKDVTAVVSVTFAVR
jgi:hypothetical protein